VNDVVMPVARVVARARGRAVPVVDSFMLTPDPPLVFGIAPIRVVSEQRVQAIAFGTMDRKPEIITIWNPLNRESSELAPFAKALDSFLRRTQVRNEIPRIWLPHAAALEIIDLLAHRYRTNRNASEELNRLGWQCHAFIEESKFPGQQVIAVACDLLCGHVATGQSSVEDRHLGALLAWLRPKPGLDTAAEADRASLLPAAAMLFRPIDDEIERLRTVAKKNTGDAAMRAREKIASHLRQSAQREWNLLLRARECFWSLGLREGNLEVLRKESQERIKFALSNNFNPPSRPHTLASLLYEYELSMEKVEDAAIRNDASMRERARRQGRAVTGEVIRVRQPNRGRHPCFLTIRTRQEILRIRRGTYLQTLDTRVRGRVLELREDSAGTKLIELRLEKGVQMTRRPNVGDQVEWVDTVVYDGKYRLQQTHSALKTAEPLLAYGTELPASLNRQLPDGNLLSVAKTLRKS